TPGAFSVGAQAPSDAVVLFDGKDLSKWSGGGGKPAGWKVVDGYAEVNGSGSIESKESFGDCQLHLEWMEPSPPSGESQGRGNSGPFTMSGYADQILHRYYKLTYPD